MKIYHKKIYRTNPDADSQRLYRIVEKCNSMTAKGERMPVCLGHTPGREATEFLTIDIGSANNFSTNGEFVYADLDLDEAFAEAIKRHRGVSCELWSDDVIWPISLLAHNRPALELEPIKYSRQGDHKSYTQTEEEPEMDVAAIKNLVNECLQSSDLCAQIKALTDTVAKQTIQLATHDEAHEKLKWLFDDSNDSEEDEGLDDPSDMETPEKNAAPESLQEKAADGDSPEVEKKAEMALPSGTNTFVPNLDTAGKKPEEEKKKKNYEELEKTSETYRLQAEEYANRITAVNADRESALGEKAALEQKYKMLQRENELIKLSQIYQFDPKAEMQLVEKMDDSQFDIHKKVVVVKYSKPPVNTPAVDVGELEKPAPVDDEVIPQAEVTRVAKYALEKKISFKKAWEEVKGKPAP